MKQALILGFLTYEYVHLPAKLAARLPGEIRQAINDKFGELNEKIIAAALRAVLGILETDMTQIRAA